MALKMENIIIKQALLINPAEKLQQTCDVEINNGIVTKITDRINSQHHNTKIINANNQLLLPGIIDSKVNIIEPSAKLASGITACCVHQDNVHHHSTDNNHQHLTVKYLAPLTEQQQGQKLTELSAALSPPYCGVTDGRKSTVNNLLLKKCYEYAATFALPVFISSLDPYLSQAGCIHEGKISTKLGLPGIPVAAETIEISRHLELIALTNIRAHFCNLASQAAVAQIAMAKQQGLPITAGVAIHHLHLTEDHVDNFNTNAHIMPPLRSAADRAALINALNNGIIDCLHSDHLPTDHNQKNVPFASSVPGIAGAELLLALAYNIANSADNKLMNILAALTCNPASVLGLSNTQGAIKIGQAANLCIFDPHYKWTIQPATIKSFGKNIPYLNNKICGKVTHTIANGYLVNSSC